MDQHTNKSDWKFPDEIVSKTMILEIEIQSLTGKKSGIFGNIILDNRYQVSDTSKN